MCVCPLILLGARKMKVTQFFISTLYKLQIYVDSSMPHRPLYFFVFFIQHWFLRLQNVFYHRLNHLIVTHTLWWGMCNPLSKTIFFIKYCILKSVSLITDSLINIPTAKKEKKKMQKHILSKKIYIMTESFSVFFFGQVA